MNGRSRSGAHTWPATQKAAIASCWHISEPERLGLGLEATQKVRIACTRTFPERSEDLIASVEFRIDPPSAGENGARTAG